MGIAFLAFLLRIFQQLIKDKFRILILYLDYLCSNLTMTQVNDTIENLKQDVAELKKLVESAKRPKVIDVLTIEIRKQETKLADLIEKEKASKKETTVTPTNNAIQAKAYDYTIRNYSWDQSEKFVKLYLTGLDGAKEVDSSNIELTLTSS